MKSIVHLGKLVFALFGIVILLLFGILLAVNQLWFIAAICFALALPYCFSAALNGSTLFIDRERVELRFLGYRRKTLFWREIQEVGIVGIKVLNGGSKSRTGSKYIYFSTKCLDDDARFTMCLNWPVKDVLYMHYSPDRIHCVQKYWPEDLVLYNTGTLEF